MEIIWAEPAKSEKNSTRSFVLALVLSAAFAVIFFAATSTATADPSVQSPALSIALGIVVTLLLLGFVDANRATKGILVSTIWVIVKFHSWGSKSNLRTWIISVFLIAISSLAIILGPSAVQRQTVRCDAAVQVQIAPDTARFECEEVYTNDRWLPIFTKPTVPSLNCFDQSLNRWVGHIDHDYVGQCGARPQDPNFITNGIALPTVDSTTVTGARLIESHERLRKGLVDAGLPNRKQKDRLILATWNMRAFGRPRFDESYLYIAQVMSHFDLIAVQEIRGDAALAKLLRRLGPDYKAVFGFVGIGERGFRERSGFIFDSRKVSFTGLSQTVAFQSVGKDALKTEGLPRPPFVAEFEVNDRRFFVGTVHAPFIGTSSDAARERAEILAVMASGLDTLFQRSYPEHPFIFAGNFQISDASGPEMNALLRNGFFTPMELGAMNTDIRKKHPRDQIFVSENNPDKMMMGLYGIFEPTEFVFRLQDADRYQIDFQRRRVQSGKEPFHNYPRSYLNARTFEISDHILKWAEFRTDW